jgi:hypothetical protein
VLPRRDFRDDSAKRLVDLDLGRDDVGKDLAPIPDDGRRRLIAGRFNAKDVGWASQGNLRD